MTNEFDWDSLSDREGSFMKQVVDDLREVAWTQPMLQQLGRTGGIRRETKALLFELRFAHNLHLVGLEARYEVAAEGASTLDFGVKCEGVLWQVELLRLGETQSVLAATKSERDEDGVLWSRRVLVSNAEDKRQSSEGETLKAIERLCQKCERDGRPHKFPAPEPGVFNVLLADIRTFLHGGDNADRIHVALGADYVPAAFRLSWEGRPITGVFDPATSLKGAKEARERLHFVGFVNEKEFASGSLSAATQLVANPNLFKDEDEVKRAIASWPLPPPVVLNLKKAT